MADFVAVIRRAVDGLANNTPEMRIRVYEKARGAVQRQLESMKPQPSEDMLRRQMEKLEAAIRDVEAEHREATPPDDAAALAAATQLDVDDATSAAEVANEAVSDRYEGEPTDADAFGPAQDTDYQQTDAPSEPQADTPAELQADYADYQEPVTAEAQPQPVQPYDVAAGHYHQPAEPEWVSEPQAPLSYPADSAEDQYAPDDVQHDAPLSSHAGDPFENDDDARYDEPAVAPVHHSHLEHASITTDEAVSDSQGFFHDAPEPEAEPVDATEREDAPLEAYDAPVSPRPAPAWPDAPSTAPVVTSYSQPEPTVDWHPEEVPPPPAPQAIEEHAWADEADYQDVEPNRQPAKTFDESAAGELFSAHFDEQTHVAAEARMPPVSDFPDLDPAPAPARSPELEPHDPFADFISAKADSVPEKAAPEPDPWNDLEELIGYDKTKAADAASGAVIGAAAGVAAAKAAGSPLDANPRDPKADNQELEELMAQPVARPYRVAPKPKRNYVGMLLGVVGLAILAGGGYALWLNRDALSGLISGTEGAAPAVQQASQPAAQPAAGTPAPAAQQPEKQTAAATPATPTGAAATPGEPQKFTQRLLADGTETDTGTGGPSAGAANQSVAQLNAPGAAPQAPAATAPPASSGTPATGTPGAAAPGVPPASQPANTVAVAGNKIFLYEERVGQSSPTAVEGSVSWSLQNEAVENGKTEPAVQGRISIPGRGLTALVTFKRNTDPSLPASHLVEFVFSLPPNFEGGTIDSVQRISMKQTEQDRGDPLVAVPAKITPDFHMIALNDFPDARARNLDLIRSRDWIDVPLVYSTGRRALLTMQKGDDGRKAFDEAVRVWQAAAPQQGQ